MVLPSSSGSSSPAWISKRRLVGWQGGTSSKNPPGGAMSCRLPHRWSPRGLGGISADEEAASTMLVVRAAFTAVMFSMFVGGDTNVGDVAVLTCASELGGVSSDPDKFKWQRHSLIASSFSRNQLSDGGDVVCLAWIVC
ncbi:hypothetical protein CC2G_014197 [Coprinopsis cinerea AmutBmut pab1-1]|nr:hypothetical protein CC2G_014197 [Coprinopsis cinerea AmutBmut pab1-1]